MNNVAPVFTSFAAHLVLLQPPVRGGDFLGNVELRHAVVFGGVGVFGVGVVRLAVGGGLGGGSVLGVKGDRGREVVGVFVGAEGHGELGVSTGRCCELVGAAQLATVLREGAAEGFR